MSLSLEVFLHSLSAQEQKTLAVIVPLFYARIFRQTPSRALLLRFAFGYPLTPGELEDLKKSGEVLDGFSILSEGSGVREGFARDFKPLLYPLAQVPFLLGIAVCGSRVHGHEGPNHDVDLFLITRKNRLWVTYLILKVLFRTRMKKEGELLDINYLVDETQLSVPYRTLFHAYEVASILPFYDAGVFSRFFSENLWVRAFFPRLEEGVHHTPADPIPASFWKRGIEKLLGGVTGDLINGLLYCFFLLWYLLRSPKVRKNLSQTLSCITLHARRTFGQGYYALCRKRFQLLFQPVLAKNPSWGMLLSLLFPVLPGELEDEEIKKLFLQKYGSSKDETVHPSDPF
jgi:hypothetical protein